jgi:hypothetical protein
MFKKGESKPMPPRFVRQLFTIQLASLKIFEPTLRLNKTTTVHYWRAANQLQTESRAAGGS